MKRMKIDQAMYPEGTSRLTRAAACEKQVSRAANYVNIC